MTITIATYKTNDNVLFCDPIYASIEQEKYCSSYKLIIYANLSRDSSIATTLYTGTYTSKKTARSAMNRYGSGWLRIN